jgi:alkylhydroperoxidase family enzyme
MSNIREARAGLIARILDGPGMTQPTQRLAAFAGDGLTDPLRELLRKVAARAHAVSDADIERVRASGLSEDEVFELVVCAAIGQAVRQHDAALSALARAAKR